MKLSIVTPHYNNFKGLKAIFLMLQTQTSTNWEWVIIDDFSEKQIVKKIDNYFKDFDDVKIVFNNYKSNASKCRNIGVEHTTSQNVVFLDSDDIITENFVKNRLIVTNDFTVFLNCNIISSKTKKEEPFSIIKTDFFNNFLKAKFAWQTTAILWNKTFFTNLGGFDTNLKLLEDIELSIRALKLSKKHQILSDNQVDFYYVAKPININNRPFLLVANSVKNLILSIKPLCKKTELKYLSHYYFLILRYFIKQEKSRGRLTLIKNLVFFKKHKVIHLIQFILGVIFVLLFDVIGKDLFLKLNRKLFKF